MKKRMKVDVLSRLVLTHVALVALVACRQAVDTKVRGELAEAHALSVTDPERAIEVAERLGERVRGWAEPHVLAGRLHAVEGNTEEAASALELALERSPENRQAALWYSRIAVAAGDASTLKQAQAALETQIAHDAGDVRLYHALGTLFEAQDDVTAALAAYRLGTERLSEVARLHLDAARIYHRLGLTGRALDRANAARQLASETQGPVYEAAGELQTRIQGGGL